jgi:Copper type II ascorbate-dependent monooxygenase, C-terminal domain
MPRSNRILWTSLPLLVLPALAAEQTVSNPEVTYSKDVAPILYRNCTGCHRPNDIAPMSLLTYKDTRPWAAAIRQAVTQRVMPPWYADPHYGKFANDPRLSEADIAKINNWVVQGAKEGDPADLPAQPTYDDSWKIGKPDAIVDIGQDFEVKKRDVPDEYIYFTVDPHFTRDTWVKAVELRPGNRRVVHHAHVWIDTSDSAPPRPRVDANGKPIPQYQYKDEFGLAHVKRDAPVVQNGCLTEDGGNLPGRSLNDGTGPLASYLPGKGPDVYPEGTAKLIPAGAKLKFQLHYNNTLGSDQTDRTQVGFVYAERPPEHPLRRVDSSAYLFLIPPGEANQEVSNCTTFQKNVMLMSYVAHMHFRGKDMRFELEHTDGSRETLLFVPHYSFAWQQIYRLKEPLLVEKGTRLIVTAHFDNSKNNKWNPDPTQTVRWGEPSTAEMMDGWVEYIDAPPSAVTQLSSETK